VKTGAGATLWRKPKPHSNGCSASTPAATPTGRSGGYSDVSNGGEQPQGPTRRCTSASSIMRELGITIGGQTLDHLAYHFVLTYSNWETGTICYSESLEN
jgi:hypothetical protein